MFSKDICPLGNFSLAFSLKAWQCLVLFLLSVSLLSASWHFWAQKRQHRVLWKSFFLFWFLFFYGTPIAVRDFGNQFCAVQRGIKWEVPALCSENWVSLTAAVLHSSLNRCTGRANPQPGLGQPPKGICLKQQIPGGSRGGRGDGKSSKKWMNK